MLKNLLANPSLEGEYLPQGAPELQLAPDWRLAYINGRPAEEGPQDSEHFCARPEYKPIQRAQHPDRVLTGETAQCAFVRWRVMDACIFQTLPVPVGRLLTARAHVQGWCSNTDEPTACDGELYFRLGLDLEGGDDPFHPPFASLVWSPWVRASPVYEELQIQAEASAPHATMIVRFWNKYRYAHNDAYMDNLALLAEYDDTQPPPQAGDCVTKAEWAAMLRAAANLIDPA